MKHSPAFGFLPVSPVRPFIQNKYFEHQGQLSNSYQDDKYYKCTTFIYNYFYYDLTVES